jgi:signal peptidase II
MMLPLCIAVVFTLLDQSTKYLVCRNFSLHESLVIIPGFFNLTYIRNTGAAWGIFAGGHLWLALLSFVMLGVIVIFRKSFLSDSLIDRTALGFIIGGIVGNLIDRLRLQYVVDFLDFHFQGHPFPAFNVADSAICIGVTLYIASQVLVARRASRTPGEGSV